MAKSWRKKADTEWSRIIRQVGHCEMCGKSRVKLHAHHIIDRNSFYYRHDLTNGLCLCAGCHTMNKWSWHKDRTACLKWLRKERPGVWKWFKGNTVVEDKQVGNRQVKVYKAISRKRNWTDEDKFYELKEII